MRRKVIASDPDGMGGTPGFADKRVLVQTPFDYKEVRDSIDEFMEESQKLEQMMIAFLKTATERVVSSTR